MRYYGITYFNNDPQSLQHGFKYIRKEPDGKGGWRYYYLKKEGHNSSAVYEKIKGSPNSKYGSYQHKNVFSGNKKVVNVYKINKFRSIKRYAGKTRDGTEVEVHGVGLLEQGSDYFKKSARKGRKKIKKIIKKTKKATNKQINNAKKWIMKK